MSFRLTVRLSYEEYQALCKICPSNKRGDMNHSELVRELIKREAERRFGMKLGSVWSELRQGRPKKPKTTETVSQNPL